MAAAGLWTTPSDLARVVIAIQRAHDGAPDSFLPQSLVRELLTPQATNVPMGLGLLLEGDDDARRFRHGGDDQGFVAALVGYVDAGVGLVAMANSDDGRAVIEPLLDALARAYDWPGQPQENEPALRAPTAAEAGAVAGAYETPEGDRIELRVADGAVALVVGGQEPIPLLPASATEWHATPLRATVHVELDGDRVTGIRIAQDAQYVQDVTAARVDDPRQQASPPG
jgi:hypothetical protein